MSCLVAAGGLPPPAGVWLLMDRMSARYGQLWRQRAGADLRGWLRSLEYYQYCASAVLLLLVPSGFLLPAGSMVYCSTISSNRFCQMLNFSFSDVEFHIFIFNFLRFFWCGRHMADLDTVARGTRMVV